MDATTTDKSDKKVHCVRLNQARTASEHRDCPYCYGKQAAVAEGDRAHFCDYQPGKDPVNFGFPEGTSRDKE